MQKKQLRDKCYQNQRVILIYFFLEHQGRLITDFYFIILRILEEYGKVHFKFILEPSLWGEGRKILFRKIFSWSRECIVTKGLFSSVEQMHSSSFSVQRDAQHPGVVKATRTVRIGFLLWNSSGLSSKSRTHSQLFCLWWIQEHKLQIARNDLEQLLNSSQPFMLVRKMGKINTFCRA